MKIAIITGASSGLGREFARQLDRKLGHTDEIWLLARRKDALEELSGTLRCKTRIIPIDLTDEKALRQFEEVLTISNPIITVLVNCAGVGSHGVFSRQSWENIDAMIKLNISALAAFVPQAAFAVYAASKAYVYSLSRALEQELKGRGITVTAVCPGPVNTPFLGHAYGTDAPLHGLKKLTLMETGCVVSKAIQDCQRGKTVSVCGLPMKLLYLTTQSVQNIYQKVFHAAEK